MTSAAVPATRRPGLLTQLAYGFGGTAEGIKNNGFDYFLLFFYSNILGVNAGQVGLALLVALVVDAISDPVVGYWSDNLRTRLGRRHPFMYGALIPVAVAYFLAWNPPGDLTGNELFPWLVGVTIAVRLGFTFYEVPSNALAAELTARVRERISPHVAPREVVFVDSLPMTATGKIMRRSLKEADATPD